MFSSVRTKNLIVATNLARNYLAEADSKLEGVPFDKIEKETSGSFPEPYQDFKWKRSVEEIDFATLSQLLTKRIQDKNKLSGVSNTESMLVSLFEEYLKKSVRKMTVKLEWPEGSGTSSLTFTQLLVNYDADFGANL